MAGNSHTVITFGLPEADLSVQWFWPNRTNETMGLRQWEGREPCGKISHARTYE